MTQANRQVHCEAVNSIARGVTVMGIYLLSHTEAGDIEKIAHTRSR
jgi:hypothetical protein